MRNEYTARVIVALLMSATAISQEAVKSLAVSGGAGSIPVTQVNGKNYVEVEALARAANGSLSFNGNQMTLTLAPTGQAAAPAASSPPVDTGFSSSFLRAGIEAMSTLREWHSALASAIENGYPVTSEGLSPYQGKAATNLGLAQAAATTNADQSMAQLIANAYQKMKQLSDKYLADRANMNYVGHDALKNDPSDQTLIACGKALGAMVASRQFTDASPCH